ncbi:hypothetical protein RGQ29_007891 [Quercus rubra]|uniref:Isopenicillin N synthase-like Fe(2+) 2OG dioxygenase domain-containing protein n=1 Tax=Quercus rubra TaxID=3512 RepID=A0AAN7I3R2_QUERU|nr:hypothetical protein RGQ29_007891 [Quercus rubra]
MDEERELIEEEELYELHYSDLMLVSEQLSQSQSQSQSRQIGEIMKALGPTGPGLLSITGVPNSTASLRRHLLSLARNLALLSPDHRLRIVKEHNLGSDVPLKNPDRSVSSFAMQLRYEQGLSHSVDTLLSSEQEHLHVGTSGEIQEDIEFKNLGNTFRKLGFCMMDLGLRIARICDKAIGGQELEKSLLESCAAKGRLIHYHSALDNLVLSEAGESKATTKRQANGRRDDKNSTRNQQGQSKGVVNLDSNGSEVGSSGIHSNLWQQWHYDYGIFTVLTSPLFLSSQATEPNDPFSLSCNEECPSPSGHTYLQIFNPYKNNVCVVKASPESFIIQVGESADIISKGKLRSTLHSVSRPSKLGSLSRETFVVFLQPAWNKTFSISDYPMKQFMSCHEETNHSEQDHNKLTQEIGKIIPPLSSRLKDGMTFAEFSRETTKQYYGGSGLQSNR